MNHILAEMVRRYDEIAVRYRERTDQPPPPYDLAHPQTVANTMQRMTAVLNNRMDAGAGLPVRWDVVEIRLDGISAHAHLEARDAAGLRAGTVTAVLCDEEGALPEAAVALWREAERRARQMCPPSAAPPSANPWTPK